MNNNNFNLLIAGFIAFALAAVALVATMLVGQAAHTGLAASEILSGGLFGAAYLVFSPRYAVLGALAVLVMIGIALAVYIGGQGIIIFGTLATGAWMVSLWLMVATCQAYTRTKKESA